VRMCYRILGDLPDAEDAAQEAFVIAFRSLASWREDGAFGAWLARIGIRIALRRAASRRRLAWLGSNGRPAQFAEEAIVDPALIAPSNADPAEAALAGERAGALRSAVRELADPYRETVVLRFFADLPLADIAAETGRPLGTVKTHLRRGLLTLRRTLIDEVGIL
jgi:RNA polymerase sigma-70 factor (ECF subfamily)